MLSPATRTRKVAGRLAISSLCRSISSSTKSSAGLGKPARTGFARMGMGVGNPTMTPETCMRAIRIQRNKSGTQRQGPAKRPSLASGMRREGVWITEIDR